jgi:hypothetical protein
MQTSALGVASQPASSADASCVGDTTASAYSDGLSAFMSVRPRLFGIVCRMLRGAADADDIVQDVWVRWQATDPAGFETARHSLSPRLHDWRSTSCSRHVRAERRAQGPGCRNQSIRARTLGWEQNEARRLRWESGYCSRGCRPRNEPRTSFGRRSTIHIVRSRTSFGLKRPTHDNS